MANDFSGDVNCVALWRFENGAETTDSKGGNTLTDNNTVQVDAVNFKEGSQSANPEKNSDEYYNIIDSALDAGFPLKNGDTTKDISICFYFRPETLPSSSQNYFLYAKYDSGSSRRSFGFAIYNDGSNIYLRLFLGYNGGASFEAVSLDARVISAGTWYHVGVTYQNSDKTYRIRLYDFGNSTNYEVTGTATLDGNKLSVEDADFTIAARHGGILYYDGNIDEFVVFKDILSQGEIDEIRVGTFGVAPPVGMAGAMTTNTGYWGW